MPASWLNTKEKRAPIDSLLAGIILLVLFGGGTIYLAVSYLYYRIVVKVDPATTFLSMLIPVWSTYLVYRTAISHPGLYLLATLAVPFFGRVIGGQGWASAATYVMYAHAMARVAEKLGHSYVTYFLLFLTPLINVIVFISLAFEGNRPLPPANDLPQSGGAGT